MCWHDNNCGLKPFPVKICQFRAHCHDCRARPSTFREALHRQGLVDVVDFECPFGVPWDTPPLVQVELPPPPKRSLLPRPGDVLAAAIKRATGIDADKVDPIGKKTCGCKQFQAEMNRWGWWGCWRRRQEIADHLSKAAAERGITVKASWPALIYSAFKSQSGNTVS